MCGPSSLQTWKGSIAFFLDFAILIYDFVWSKTVVDDRIIFWTYRMWTIVIVMKDKQHHFYGAICCLRCNYFWAEPWNAAN